MDSQNLETFEKAYSMIESESMNFERKYRELSYELGRKRILLDETRELLNQAISKQHELEIKLECEKRDKESKIKDMALLKNVAKEFEEFRSSSKENNTHKIELEIIRKENEVFKLQVHDLQQENIKLKRELEDMQGKHNCLQAFQKDIMEQQNKIKSCISQYVKTSKFTGEIDDKMKKFEESYNICSKLEMYTELANKRTQHAYKQNEELEHEIIRLRAELYATKEQFEAKISTSSKDHNEDIEYWKNAAEERSNQLEVELKNMAILTKNFEDHTLKISKSVQNEIEQYQTIKKFKETIEELQNENSKLKQRKIMIDIEIQTDEKCLENKHEIEEQFDLQCTENKNTCIAEENV